MNRNPSLQDFIAFLRKIGVRSIYAPDDSEYIELAYDRAIETVNDAIRIVGGLDYPLAVYNLGTDYLFNYAQDRTVGIESASWAGGTVSVVSAEDHGFSIGETFYAIISNVLPIAYDLPLSLSGKPEAAFKCLATGTNTFTYPLVANPGATTALGAWQEVRNVEMNAKGGPRPFFQFYREVLWSIDNPISGVMTGSGDAGTAGSISVPPVLQNLGIGELQNYKTKFGRAYLAIAAKYGDAWVLA